MLRRGGIAVPEIRLTASDVATVSIALTAPAELAAAAAKLGSEAVLSTAAPAVRAGRLTGRQRDGGIGRCGGAAGGSGGAGARGGGRRGRGGGGDVAGRVRREAAADAGTEVGLAAGAAELVGGSAPAELGAAGAEVRVADAAVVAAARAVRRHLQVAGRSRARAARGRRRRRWLGRARAAGGAAIWRSRRRRLRRVPGPSAIAVVGLAAEERMAVVDRVSAPAVLGAAEIAGASPVFRAALAGLLAHTQRRQIAAREAVPVIGSRNAPSGQGGRQLGVVVRHRRFGAERASPAQGRRRRQSEIDGPHCVSAAARGPCAATERRKDVRDRPGLKAQIPQMSRGVGVIVLVIMNAATSRTAHAVLPLPAFSQLSTAGGKFRDLPDGRQARVFKMWCQESSGINMAAEKVVTKH